MQLRIASMVWLVLTLVLLAAMALVIRLPRHHREEASDAESRRKRTPSVVPLDPSVAEHAEAVRRSRPAR